MIGMLLPASSTRDPDAMDGADRFGVKVHEVRLGSGERWLMREEPVQVLVVQRGTARTTGDAATPRISAFEVMLLPAGRAACLEPTSDEPLSALLFEAPEALAALAGADELPSGRYSLDPAIERTILRALMRIQFEGEAQVHPAQVTDSTRSVSATSVSTGAGSTGTVSSPAESTELGPIGLRIEMAVRMLSLLARPNTHSKRVPHPLGTGASAHGQESLQRVRRYIDQLDRLLHEPADVDRVATALDLSRRRFTDLFRQLTGSTWQPYLQQVRMRHAIRLLEHGTIPIPTIAFACGFDDPSTFYRAFRRVTGTTPKEYGVR